MFLNRKCLFLRGSFSEKRNFLSICSTWKYFSARWFLFVLCGTNFVNAQMGNRIFVGFIESFPWLMLFVRARKTVRLFLIFCASFMQNFLWWVCSNFNVSRETNRMNFMRSHSAMRFSLVFTRKSVDAHKYGGAWAL